MFPIPVHETGVLASQRRAVRCTTSLAIQGAVVVPPGVQWDISSVAFHLTESAVVGPRNIEVSISDPNGNIVFIVATVSTPAALGSQTLYLTMFPGCDTNDVQLVELFSTRPFLSRLYDGYVIYYSVGLPQVGDVLQTVVSYNEVT